MLLLSRCTLRGQGPRFAGAVVTHQVNGKINRFIVETGIFLPSGIARINLSLIRHQLVSTPFFGVNMSAATFFRSSMFAALVLGGCSVVYPIQYVPSTLTTDYRDGTYTFKIVDLTPAAAQEANALWRYQPRAVPPGLQSSASPADTAVYRATSLGEEGDTDSYLMAQVAQNLDYTSGPSDFQFRNPPRSLPQPYKVGVGDTFTVTIESVSSGTSTAFQREVIVDYAGNIYLTDVGEVNILGMTVAEARQAVADRFRDARLSANGSGAVTGFNSQKVTVSSPGKITSFIPITTVPITLREAYLRFSSGIDEDAMRQVVVMRRNGEEYPIRGKDVLRKSYGYDVYLRDADEIQIFDSALSGVPSAAIAPDVLALSQARLSRDQFERTEARAEREEQRAEEVFQQSVRNEQRAREQLELARQTEARLARAEARADSAESRALREEARRDAELARAQREEARRDAENARAERDEARRNAAEARAEAAEARAARDLALAEQRSRLDSSSAQRELTKSRIDLGIEAQDRIFVGGEVGKQRTVALPFGRQYTLAEAIYGSEGLEPITADPADIYVVRVKSTVGEAVESYIFRFDHANLANTAAMTMFEMRPNDYVVSTPRAISNWSRFISQLLPTFSTLLSAARGI